MKGCGFFLLHNATTRYFEPVNMYMEVPIFRSTHGDIALSIQLYKIQDDRPIPIKTLILNLLVVLLKCCLVNVLSILISKKLCLFYSSVNTVLLRIFSGSWQPNHYFAATYSFYSRSVFSIRQQQVARKAE